ncbi:ribosome maturation factor RimM [Leucobacter chromiireducens]|uniref:Ribosome maturation factor RimM n=1 Tax=Leucobacter chromiireducens subsp. solipictus TaxID=398235 RepID=A0ABS1SGJ1_9MICO|nr:ribosome maturation factor RimM [Leucobacter chromiireducens]MBL3679580.1 ribosome maturation factor RimM [Leucobacter chromiireducens subsp. solipictus]
MADASGRVQAPRPASGAGSLRVGRLTKPHGLKGGIKLELFTDNPELRFTPGAEFFLQVPEDSPWFGRTITMRELRWFNDSPVGFFEEVPDRSGAESIVRAILWIDEQTVAEGTEDNAWYDHELVGLDVVRGSEKLGTVAEVRHFPAQDLLVVNTASGAVLVPFVQAIVPSVDIDAGVVTVTPPPGLFEEQDAEVAGGPGTAPADPASDSDDTTDANTDFDANTAGDTPA